MCEQVSGWWELLKETQQQELRQVITGGLCAALSDNHLGVQVQQQPNKSSSPNVVDAAQTTDAEWSQADYGNPVQNRTDVGSAWSSVPMVGCQSFSNEFNLSGTGGGTGVWRVR
jgi:hypothetical protein